MKTQKIVYMAEVVESLKIETGINAKPTAQKKLDKPA